MKYTILWIALLHCFLNFGQTASEYFDAGRQKQDNYDYDGALKDYSKALEIDAAFAEAYYVRASLLYDQDNYLDALQDLSKMIALKPSPMELYMAGLKLRGKIYLEINNKEKACPDFIEASSLGASVDEAYLKLCNYKEIKNEVVFMKLLDTKYWKISYKGIANKEHKTLVVNVYDTVKKPSEYLSIVTKSEKKRVDLVTAMNDSYKIIKDKSQEAKLSFIAKDVKAKEPWIVYLVEGVVNEECQCKEAQVWYLVQGENFFHSCYRTIRKDLYEEEKKEEIIKVFTTAKIVYQ